MARKATPTQKGTSTTYPRPDYRKPATDADAIAESAEAALITVTSYGEAPRTFATVSAYEAFIVTTPDDPDNLVDIHETVTAASPATEARVAAELDAMWDRLMSEEHPTP